MTRSDGRYVINKGLNKSCPSAKGYQENYLVTIVICGEHYFGPKMHNVGHCDLLSSIYDS